MSDARAAAAAPFAVEPFVAKTVKTAPFRRNPVASAGESVLEGTNSDRPYYSVRSVHEEVLRDVIREALSEEDAPLWMLLLHTHQIRLRAPLMIDAPNETSIHALTWRGAADVMAHLWPARSGKGADPNYWYWEYTRRHFPERVSDFPQALATRVGEMRDRLNAHPDVADVVPAQW